MTWKSSTWDDLKNHWHLVQSAILATAGLLVLHKPRLHNACVRHLPRSLRLYTLKAASTLGDFQETRTIVLTTNKRKISDCARWQNGHIQGSRDKVFSGQKLSQQKPPHLFETLSKCFAKTSKNVLAEVVAQKTFLARQGANVFA